jgi:septin family protein
VDTSTPQHISELKEAGLDPKHVSASRNEYVQDDGNYVMIEGKYYKARADNTYNVNGRRVYYVNNRRYGQEEVDAASEPQGEVDEASVKRVTADDDKLLASPQEMMQKLQKAKQDMSERNEYLKELEKE